MFRDLLSDAVERVGHTLKLTAALDDDFRTLIEPADCLIVHLQSLDKTVLDRLEDVVRQQPDLAVTILCSPGLEPLLHMETGHWVSAIIPDNKSLELVIGTLGVVSRGFTVMDRTISGRFHDIGGTRAEAPNACAMLRNEVGLSKREVSVLKEIRVGRSNKEIARELDISDSTVKVHMRSIFRKIGVRNRTEAAMWVNSNC